MSFSGKRFRRSGCSNLEDFFKAANPPEQVKHLINSNAPIWCYTLLDDQTLQLILQLETFTKREVFKLGVEHEFERLDGAKVHVIFTLEGDNVLKQRIRQPGGSIAHLRREFHERTATMTITLEGVNIRKAYVFYEMID